MPMPASTASPRPRTVLTRYTIRSGATAPHETVPRFKAARPSLGATQLAVDQALDRTRAPGSPQHGHRAPRRSGRRGARPASPAGCRWRGSLRRRRACDRLRGWLLSTMSSLTSGHWEERAKSGVSRWTSSVSLVVTRSSPAGEGSRPETLRVKSAMSSSMTVRQSQHFLPRRGGDVTEAVALEELGPQRSLYLPQPPEDSRVVDAQPLGGAGRPRPPRSP